jgi:hypothetical protein
MYPTYNDDKKATQRPHEALDSPISERHTSHSQYLIHANTSL